MKSNPVALEERLELGHRSGIREHIANTGHTEGINETRQKRKKKASEKKHIIHLKKNNDIKYMRENISQTSES